MHPLLTRHQRRATDAEPEPSLTRDQVAWAIGGLCRSHRIPFDAELLLQQVPPPYTWSSLQVAATRLGMRCMNRSVRLSRIPADFLPCLVPLRDASPNEPGKCQPAMVVRIDNGEALYFVPGEAEPRHESVEALMKRHAGTALFATPERPEPDGDGDGKAKRRPFGFRWFVPELLKYRSIWRDVLIASVAIAKPLGLRGSRSPHLRSKMRARRRQCSAREPRRDSRERTAGRSGAHRRTPATAVSAEIVLGRRTVLEYLLSSLQKTIHEAGRER
jgi:hypothetical protein